MLQSRLTRTCPWIFGLLVGALLCVLPAGAGPADPFPEPRPLTRGEAAASLVDPTTEHQLLNTKIRTLREQPGAGAAEPARNRALAMLMSPPVLATERVWAAPDRTLVHYTVAESAVDRVSPADRDRNGVPDRVQAVGQGVIQARELLVERMGFDAPQRFEVVLADLGGRFDGYLIPSGRRHLGTTAVLDSSPQSNHDSSRRAAIRQYAHALARSLGTRLDTGWTDALANWAVLAIDGRPDDHAAPLISRRLDRLDLGLFTDEATLAAGNAIWLAYLQEAYGLVAVRTTLEALARGSRAEAALDRALARSTDDDLATAFREFHVWTILTGRRADAFHFPFAADLGATRFASTNVGLPALSVQADPPLATWGAAQILIRPEAADGGLRVRFEGEFAARWEADLLVVSKDGTLRRLVIELADGHGEIAVPLGSVREALLLVRNLDADARSAGHYTYAVHRERGYPFEIVALDAVANEVGAGVAITWETASEQELIGFNVLRQRELGGQEVTVSAVWVPALGNESDPTSYFYLDPSAEPDVAYLYRIQGITQRGMTSSSTQVNVRPAQRSR